MNWFKKLGQNPSPRGDARELSSELADLKEKLNDLQQNFWQLSERLEFARREILFEFVHGGGPQHGKQRTDPRVVAPSKVERAKQDGSLAINLGCGHLFFPDYINIDMRDVPNVDIVATVDDLPPIISDVSEIYSSHLLEHFEQEALTRRLLPYWFGLLRPGGVFRAVVPDAAAMIAGAGAGTYGFADFRQVLFGAQDYTGDYHYNLFTPDSLRGLLSTAGFVDTEIVFEGRRNGQCFDFEIKARRPDAA